MPNEDVKTKTDSVLKKRVRKKLVGCPLIKPKADMSGCYYGDIPPRHRPPSKPSKKESGTKPPSETETDVPATPEVS